MLHYSFSACLVTALYTSTSSSHSLQVDLPHTKIINNKPYNEAVRLYTWLKEYHAWHNVGSTHHAPSYYNFLRPTLDCAYGLHVLFSHPIPYRTLIVPYHTSYHVLYWIVHPSYPITTYLIVPPVLPQPSSFR